MQKFGLIGFPLSHSFSKGYFTEKFKREGIEASYDNYPIEQIGLLRGVVSGTPGLCGLNVTIPYKEQVLNYLDELDEEASLIGAVNTIVILPDARLKGFNTDAFGFENSLKPLLKENRGQALILGSGGASRAVRYVLEKLGINYLMASRNPSGELAVSYDRIGSVLAECRLVVNTTPLGMYPQVESCPDIPYHLLGKDHLLFDLIYNPAETLFMKKGKKQGASTCNGLTMLELQAERAWKIWNNSNS